MTTMFVRHHVANFADWKKEYDGFDSERRTLGVTAQAVYQITDDPNDVTATHEFANVAAGKAFIANPALKEAMKRGGVQGEPTIWFANRA
jgi:hypothetical protein